MKYLLSVLAFVLLLCALGSPLAWGVASHSGVFMGVPPEAWRAFGWLVTPTSLIVTFVAAMAWGGIDA